MAVKSHQNNVEPHMFSRNLNPYSCRFTSVCTPRSSFADAQCSTRSSPNWFTMVTASAAAYGKYAIAAIATTIIIIALVLTAVLDDDDKLDLAMLRD